MDWDYVSHFCLFHLSLISSLCIYNPTFLFFTLSVHPPVCWPVFFLMPVSGFLLISSCVFWGTSRFYQLPLIFIFFTQLLHLAFALTCINHNSKSSVFSVCVCNGPLFFILLDQLSELMSCFICFFKFSVWLTSFKGPDILYFLAQFGVGGA